MLKRDFIMVQIEELGKVIAQLIFNRTEGGARKNPALIQTVYNSLDTDQNYLLSTPLDKIRQKLDKEDNAGLQRMELAAKTLLEESYLYPEKAEEIRRKVKEILMYVQQHDTTFSLERVSLLAGLEEEN